MMTSKVILNNIRSKDTSSLFNDLQVFLDTTDDKCQISDVLSILKAVYHLMKGYEDQDEECNEISQLVPSVSLCVDYIKSNCLDEESFKHQFLQILCYVIKIYFKCKLHSSALLYAANLKEFVSTEHKSTDNDKENFIKFLYALFWNEALHLEKKDALINFETIFLLRCQAVEYAIFSHNLTSIKDNTYLIFAKYFHYNQNKDPNDIIIFLQRVWMQINDRECFDHILYLYKLLYSWFEASIKYCTDVSILKFVLSLMSEFSLNFEDSDRLKSFKACLTVSKCSIQIFLLNEKASTSEEDLLKFSLSHIIDIDLVAYTCGFFYFSLLKIINSIENHNVLSLIEANLNFCSTMVLHYLDFFPKINLEKSLPFNVNSDITLSRAFMKIFSSLLKNNEGDEKRINIMINAKDFVQKSLEKLHSEDRNDEFSNKFSCYAITIGNIGFSLYNSGHYSESAYFLEAGLPYAFSDGIDEERSYKWRQILVYDYLLSGNYKKSLQTVVKLLLDFKSKRKECMELWHKVKRDASRNQDISVFSSTISDVLAEIKVEVDETEEELLLLQELRGCKSERCRLEEETLNVVKKLISVQCKGVNWATAMLEIITMGSPISKKVSLLLNKSSLDMCSESIKLFEKHIKENPTNNEVKLQLSISHVWFFFLKLQQLHKFAKKEAAVDSNRPKSEDEEGESDMMPTIPLLTYLVEAETVKSLEMALELWSDIFEGCENSQLAEAVKNWDLLTVVQSTARFFSLSAHDVDELRTLIILQKIASAVGNKEHELNSLISLVNFLVRIGYLEMASQLLKVSEISISDDTTEETLKYNLKLAKSNLYLQKGKFDEGLDLLRSILEDPIFKKSYRSVNMLQIQSLMLLSKFLLVPPSAFSDTQNVNYLNLHNAISTAMECGAKAKRLLKASTGKQANEGCNDWILVRAQLLKNILSVYLLLGENYIRIGDPRLARCFLLEGLKVAEENILTYWSSKFLILLGQVDLICRDINECMVKLNTLQYIMNENSKENALMLQSKAFSNTETSDPIDASEEFLIPSETRVYFKRSIKQNFINNSDVHSSPISTRRETNKFEVKSNAFVENMLSVYLIKLEIWALSCLHLIAENKTLFAEKQLEKLLKKYELVKQTNKKIVNMLKTFVKDLFDLKKESLNKIPTASETLISVKALLNMSLLYFTKGNFQKTESYMDYAFKALRESSEHEKYLHSDMYGILKYHKVVVSLKNFLGVKSDACVECNICPSVEVKSLSTRNVPNQITPVNVETPKKNVPKILVTPCLKKRTCKAPLKKDVLPVHIKQDMGVLTNSNKKSSLIFSSSDDEFFASPHPSAKKTVPSVGNKDGLENEKNTYKLFKSKNSDLDIKASCDIWKFPDLATPKVKKTSKSKSSQITHLSVRKTRQNSRMIKSDSNCSKLLNNTSVKQSRKLRSNAKSERGSNKDITLESSSLVDKERKFSIEHYRGTSKTRQEANIFESVEAEEVFYPDCIGEDLHSDKPKVTSHLRAEDKNYFMETLCNDFNEIKITENTNNNIEHLIPEEKLEEFINELDQIRLLILHNAPYPLYVNLCRLLAVLKMCKNPDSTKSHDFGFLLSETFASILREVYVGNYSLFKEGADVEENSPRELSKLLKRKEECVIKQMECLLRPIPIDYTVVQITPLFEQELVASAFTKYTLSKLIICRYQQNCEPLVMCLSASSSETLPASIFTDFNNILLESNLIMKNSDRKSWWTTRNTLNMRLKSLVKSIENSWFGCWKGLLLSTPTNEKRVKHLKKIKDTICKLAEPSDKKLLEVLLDSASVLSKGQICAAVCHIWNCKQSDEVFSTIFNSLLEATVELPETKRNPLVLILDKDIQALPWESLPILNDIPVSRMPSLTILVSKLSMPDVKSTLKKGFNSAKTFYILNPGGDLKYSQELFQSKFQNQTNWKGIVGKPPSGEECASALKNYDMFVYCGHGSGRQYLGGIVIDKMLCHASAILMGCSSGRLKQYGKQLEAYGIPLTYLMNGCPCVVGNLWDVTDKDIDRFTDKFFELLVPNYKEDNMTTDVANAVTEARNSCTMRYLVGSAPVIYGLPVFATK